MKNTRTWKTAFITGAIIALTAATVACNNNSVVISSGGDSPIGKSFQTGGTSQNKMDILWVIDDSGSMAEEQYQLINNFNQFINTLQQNSIDAHIAVTSTNQPNDFLSGAPSKKLSAGFKQGQFFRKTYGEFSAGAFSNNISQNSFQDFYEQAWKCAGHSAPHPAADAYSAIQGDNKLISDYFPHDSDYKIIPQAAGGFLDTSKYDQKDGKLSAQGAADLVADFRCLALVGLAGNYVETGIGSAVKALDPNGPNKSVLANFIRPDAKFVLIIVSDENDCSRHDVELVDEGGTLHWDVNSGVFCPALCELFNTENGLPPGIPNILDDPKKSAETLLKELAEIKKVKAVDKDDVIAMSISGPDLKETINTLPLTLGKVPDWNKLTTDDLKNARSNILTSILIPASKSTGNACSQATVAITPSITYGPLAKQPTENAKECLSGGAWGNATSANRYIEFVSNFGYSYPPIAKDVTQAKKDALICGADFKPIWDNLSSLIKSSLTRQCVDAKDLTGACASKKVNDSCGDGKGKCMPIPGSPSPGLYCSSLVQVVLTPASGNGSALEKAKVGGSGAGAGTPYCLPGSYGSLVGLPDSCVLNPKTYTFTPCFGGMKFTYNDIVQAKQDLSGVKTELKFTAIGN